MTNYDIVKKLIGEIEPAGDSAIDEKRFENLEATIKLAERLVADIISVSKDKNSYMHSVSKSGKRAFQFLQHLRDILDNSNLNKND